MKTHTRLLALFVFLTAMVLGACSPSTSEQPDQLGFTDFAGLVDAMESNGVKVEVLEMISQPFLNADGRGLRINGQDIQVFEYVDEAAAIADAETISPDGSSTGTTMITWIDNPHLYRSGKLIVIYVGSDKGTLIFLESLFGPQFAGQ